MNYKTKSIVSSSLNFLPSAFLVLITLAIGALAHTDADKKADSDESKKVDEAYIREHYTKFEYDVPMRDGVNLMFIDLPEVGFYYMF